MGGKWQGVINHSAKYHGSCYRVSPKGRELSFFKGISILSRIHRDQGREVFFPFFSLPCYTRRKKL